jgi:hypothetical protein
MAVAANLGAELRDRCAIDVWDGLSVSRIVFRELVVLHRG